MINNEKWKDVGRFGLRQGKSHYKISQIKKICIVYINSKFVILPGSKLGADFLNGS